MKIINKNHLNVLEFRFMYGDCDVCPKSGPIKHGFGQRLFGADVKPTRV